MKNILAVILARGGSKGIPKKNIINISGHPLISYSIEAAKNSKFINDLVVSTDDKNIATVAKKYGAKIPFIRSKNLAQDKTPSVDALYDCVLKTENFYKKKYDYVVELPCVSPLRDHNDIDEALNILIKQKYDSVISYVNTGEKHPTRLKRINNNKATNFCEDYPEPDVGSRRQDFEACYIRNGAIYSMTRNCIIKRKSRNGKNSYPYIMSSNKSINIDEKFDLKLASLLIESGECVNKPKLVKKIRNIKSIKNYSRYNLLITAPFEFLLEERKKLEKKFNCNFSDDLNKENVIKNLTNCDAWLCQPSPEYKINKIILKKALLLKTIITPSTGTTHIDLNYCNKRNIKVIPITVLDDFKKITASSEYTFMMGLLSQRKIFESIRLTKQGYWRDVEKDLRGFELSDKKVAIIGFGRIGKNLLKYSLAFNAKPLVYDPYTSNKSKYLKKDLSNVISTADLVFICISFSKKNIDFVNKNFISKMKNVPALINTSRGEVINELDLIRALKTKKIRSAYVDVVKNEQKLKYKKNLLINYSRNNKNLIVTPHIAGLTFDSEKKAANICIKNLSNFFKVNDNKKK